VKRFYSLFLAVLLAVFPSVNAFSSELAVNAVPIPESVVTEASPTDETKEATKPSHSVVMAINQSKVLLNGVQTEITPPVYALGRTYVDLNSVAPLLNLSLEWVEDTFGFFRVHYNENTADFKFISQWGNLLDEKHRLFVKDSVVYASLRELVDLTGYSLTYSDGVITVGDAADFTGMYQSIAVSDISDYVYSTYPCPAEYVVYPYQAYSYETMLSDAKKLQRMYPELIKTSSIGKSVENRDLLLIEFGKGPNKIFVCGAHHAREYISTTYLMYAIDRYAYAAKNNALWGKYNPKAILDGVTFCIVPMVNPDGVNLVQNGINATNNAAALSTMGLYDGTKYGYRSWKANINGVDVNWNYDKDWYISRNKHSTRGSTGFNGDMPHTEPETIAVSNYVDTHPFDAYLSFHSQGQIFYWADSVSRPTYLQDAIKKDTGFTPSKDPVSKVGGSFFDYVYRKYDKPTITVELCPYVGPYPYPDTDFDTVWNPVKNVLLVAANEIIYLNSQSAPVLP